MVWNVEWMLIMSWLGWCNVKMWNDFFLVRLILYVVMVLKLFVRMMVMMLGSVKVILVGVVGMLLGVWVLVGDMVIVRMVCLVMGMILFEVLVCSGLM